MPKQTNKKQDTASQLGQYVATESRGRPLYCFDLRPKDTEFADREHDILSAAGGNHGVRRDSHHGTLERYRAAQYGLSHVDSAFDAPKAHGKFQLSK